VLPAGLLAARLDMRQEVMETLLSYLEVRLVAVLNRVHCVCLPAYRASSAVCSYCLSTP
jgi:hypothetical protein